VEVVFREVVEFPVVQVVVLVVAVVRDLWADQVVEVAVAQDLSGAVVEVVAAEAVVAAQVALQALAEASAVVVLLVGEDRVVVVAILAAPVVERQAAVER
jgi:hypothetical protein